MNPDYHAGLQYKYIPEAVTAENRVGRRLKCQESNGHYVPVSNFKAFDDGAWAVYNLNDNMSKIWLHDTFSMCSTNITSNCGLAGDLVVDVEMMGLYTALMTPQ